MITPIAGNVADASKDTRGSMEWGYSDLERCYFVAFSPVAPARHNKPFHATCEAHARELRH